MPLSTQVDLSKTKLELGLPVFLSFIVITSKTCRRSLSIHYFLNALDPVSGLNDYLMKLRTKLFHDKFSNQNILSFRIFKSVSEMWSRQIILSKWRLTAKNLKKIFVSPVGATSILFVVKLDHVVMQYFRDQERAGKTPCTSLF